MKLELVCGVVVEAIPVPEQIRTYLLLMFYAKCLPTYTHNQMATKPTLSTVATPTLTVLTLDLFDCGKKEVWANRVLLRISFVEICRSVLVLANQNS